MKVELRESNELGAVIFTYLLLLVLLSPSGRLIALGYIIEVCEMLI